MRTNINVGVLQSWPQPRLAAVCAMTLFLLVAQSYTTHATQYYQFDGHTYFLSTTFGSIGDVRAEALADGADLVSINSAQEEAFIENTFLPLLPTGEFDLWIGLHAVNNVWGNWGWFNGDPVTYTKWGNWGVPEPNNASLYVNGHPEDYVVLHNAPPVGWADWPDFTSGGGYSARGIIEKVPDASDTAVLLSLAFGGLALLRRRLT